MRNSALILFVLLVLCSDSGAQVSISSLGAAYTETFDGMGSFTTATLPVGFKIGTDWSSGTTATTVAYGSSGAGVVSGSSAGGVVNWADGITASATDRSLGFLNTGSFSSPRSIVFALVNDTESTITGLTITFDYEQTRSGTRQFDWTFFHGSTSTASIAAIAGDQSYAAEANNTTVFNPPTTTSKSVTLTGLSIAPGATYYIRWTFTGVGGSTNGKGIGIDNLSLTATSCTAPTATVTGSATICSGNSTTIEAALTGTGPWDVTWSDSVTQTGITTSPATRTVSPTTTTTYTVNAVSDTTGCTPGTFSGSAVVTVNQPVTPSASISANPGTTTCSGNPVIFTATPVNGGGSPTYVWKTNGVQDTSVPSISATYTNSNLANDETIDCQMTSSLTCVTSPTADALQLKMTITSSVTPSVTVLASPAATICAGSQVIFTATPANGGSSPAYVWKTNGVHDTSVPANSATYTNSSLANGDTIDCQLISNDSCASPTTADALQITMTVNAVFSPSVSVSVDPGSIICSNSSVTFTATPVNGGASPTFQWKTNNANVTGQTAATFTTSLLKNGDVVTVVMTPSSEICVFPLTATSDEVTLTVNPIPSSTISAASGVVQNSTGNIASVPDAGVGGTYVWTISGGTITAGQGTASLTYTAGNAIGTLTLGCTVTSSASCSSVGSLNVSVHAPVLAGWDVSTLPGGANNFGTSPLAATSSDANLSIGGLTRGSGVVTTGATGAARAWGGVDWQSTSAANAVTANKFATFTVSAHAGYKVSFNAISRFDYRRSGTGPGSGVLQYQAGETDTFHDITTVSYTSSASSGGALSPIDLSGITALQDVPAGTEVTFRIVNYGATSSAGTWYVFDTANNTASDFEVAGYVTCVPPTATVAGDSAICAGGSTSFATTLTGVGPWNVTWSDGAISNNVSSSPVVRTVSPAATTLYTVTSLSDAVNCAPGTFSGSATVTVNPLPTVAILPAATNAECSSTVTFSADASGDGPLIYQWYDNLTNAIPNETNVTLTLSNVHEAAEGNYTFVVTGPFCSASAVASLSVSDSIAPVLAILGDNPATNECHIAYTDAGATASDVCAGDVTVTTNITVDANTPGAYTVIYTAEDGNGNTNTATRTVYVEDTTAPLITYYFTNLTMSANGSCEALMPDVTGTNYILAEDGCSSAVTITQSPTNNAVLALGTNEVVLTVADSGGNTVNSTNTIVVVDVAGPVVTIMGDNPLMVECHAAFVDPGASANDNCSGVAAITTNGIVNAEVPGSYLIEYSATDAAGNATTNTRVVNVVDTTAPALTILGDNPATNECHIAYTDAGATASDACAGVVSVSTNNLVDANVPGVYTVIYTADDGNGNTNTATRTVYVTDTFSPALAILGANPATNECHVPYVDVGVAALDACAGFVEVATNSTVDANTPGVYLVTYTTDDGNGNTNSVSRTVYVVDTLGPTLTILGANPATNECHIAYVDAGATAMDACSGSMTVSTNGIVEANVPGVYTVVYTSDDGNGNTNTATRTIYVVDTVGPVIGILGSNPATNECHVAYLDTGATANDACVGSVVLSTNSTVDANVPGIYSVTYTSDDGNGNTNTATRVVYVVDTTSPEIVCSPNKTAECGSAWAFDEPTANDECSGTNVIVAVLETMTNGNVFTRSWAASDPAGNTNTCSQSVTVLSDTAPPVITYYFTNLTLSADGNCQALMPDVTGTNYILAEDACSVVTITQMPTNNALLTLGINEVVLTVADSAGNTVYSTNTIVVVDVTGPSITVQGVNPSTNECHVAYLDAGATANDACVGVVSVSTNGAVDANVPGIYTVIYTADDGNGNTNTATRSVYVIDTSAPMLTILGANPHTNECHVAYVDAGATASDVCAGDVTVTTNITVDANTPGAYTVIYTAEDGNGNTNTATRTVYVEDTTAPLITYYFTNLTMSANGSCEALMPDVTGTNYILAEDGCSSAVTITQSPTNNAVLALGTNEVVLTVADSGGNTVNSTNTIVVVDVAGPVVTIMGDNPLMVECHAAFVDPGASANDNCSGVAAITTNGIVNAEVPGSYLIEYSATDAAGNATTNTRVVNVVDTTAPALTILGDNPATNECHIAYTDAGATASDACAGVVSVSTNNLVDANVPGVYTVIYTADDGNGNTNTATRTVYVTDTFSPALAILGANPATNECHVPYVDVGVAALDACAGFVEVATNSTVDANTPGVYLVTYTTDDGNGNTNSVSRTVYVVDTLGPTLTILGANPATNECHIAYVDAGATAMDACSGSMTVSTNGIVEANVPGVYTVVYTSDDGNGNTNTATRTIYVVDTTPPLITQCATNRTMVVDNNCLVTLPDFTGELSVSDACSLVTVSQSPSPGTEVGVGQHLISFTASDITSNSAVCSFLLNVTAPASANTNISISEFMAKNTVTITDNFGDYSDWVEIHNAGSCSVNLDGWALTDNSGSLAKWLFPATNIGPGQFIVVWASDRNQRTPGAPLHTNFKLSDEGEYLALVQPSGVAIATQFTPAFPPQLPDVSYGLPANAPTNTFLAWATPGSANSPATNFTSGATNVIISEFMAKNSIGPVDDFGAHSDWIEIYNGGCCPVDLNGWSLTDNAASLAKWRFPATNIGPGEFIVVWASDRNRRIPGAPLHTNFKLADEGEYLALVQPDGVTIASQFAPVFPPQLTDVSYGISSDGLTNSYLASPTPGSSNSVGTSFIVADLEFNPRRGWYSNSVVVSITTATPEVTIYCTTNGTVPGPTNGFLYAGPMVFSNTTVLRAAAYKPAYIPKVETHSYIFPGQVVYQTGAGFPTNWGYTALGVVPTYYSCNSNLVADPRWGDQMPKALVSVPTLSVVMNGEDMFGTNGIYSNPLGSGSEWERACSVEYLRKDLEPGFQINCGIRMHGQSSRNPEYTPKHSLRLLFKQAYGAGKLDYDLYPGSPVREFDALVLHAYLGDHWFGGTNAQMLRDQWCNDTQEEMGGYGAHGVYVNLFINGLYWGLYNMGERPDAAYAARYLGGKESDYDALHGDEVQGGNTNAWHELLSLAQAGITNEVAWSNVCRYLNVPHYIDYALMNFYAVNIEWLSHNWWINGSVANGVPFHVFSWDAEDALGTYAPNIPIDYDVIGLAEVVPTWQGILFSSLRQYPEFRRTFGDHAQQLLFNYGALTPERTAARWMKRAREIDQAIIAESVRWGITNWWAAEVWGSDWRLNTRDDWLGQQAKLMTNWFPLRTDMLINQLRDAGLYPALGAPVFAPHGGIITDTLSVAITSPQEATLYYTTNGTDPRMPDGGVSPDALVYDQNVPLTLVFSNDCRLTARAFATNTWSALVEADYIRVNQVELKITDLTRNGQGHVRLDFMAWPGVGYTLRASTNLTNWEGIATLVPFPDGTFTFVDTSATNYPVRLYRLTWP